VVTSLELLNFIFEFQLLMFQNWFIRDLGERLVRVQAQVMTWNDKFSGWIPVEQGGVSTVCLYQKLTLRSVTSSADLGSKLIVESSATATRQTDAATLAPQATLSTTNGRRRLSPRYDYIIESCHTVDKQVDFCCESVFRNYKYLLTSNFIN